VALNKPPKDGMSGISECCEDRAIKRAGPLGRATGSPSEKVMWGFGGGGAGAADTMRSFQKAGRRRAMQ